MLVISLKTIFLKISSHQNYYVLYYKLIKHKFSSQTFSFYFDFSKIDTSTDKNNTTYAMRLAYNNE